MNCDISLTLPPPQVILSKSSGQFEEVTVVNVTLSCDHRVIDGAMGAEWLQVRVCVRGGWMAGWMGKGCRWEGGGRGNGRVEGVMGSGGMVEGREQGQ